jgi:hypothetical protein
MASKDKTVKVINDHGPMGWILFTAWIGALIYFSQQAEGFVGLVIAFLKSAVWPAYVLHAVLELLKI